MNNQNEIIKTYTNILKNYKTEAEFHRCLWRYWVENRCLHTPEEFKIIEQNKFGNKLNYMNTRSNKSESLSNNI